MKMDWNLVNLLVTILLAIGGFIGSLMVCILGALINRLSKSLDELNDEIESLKLDMKGRPDHEWIRDEASRVSRDVILAHENRLHRGKGGA